MNITVETADLRAALRSVAPHADPSADFPQLHRIRFTAGPENLAISATQRYSFAHSIVSIWEQGDGELGEFDLSPQDVKEILALFRAPKADKDEQPDATLQIAVDDEAVCVTDWGGLFPGKSLRLPRYPTEENFPDVTRIIKDKLASGSEAAEQLVTSGAYLGLFMKAADAYKQPLVIQPAGNTASMLITCGESFVGLLQPVRIDDARDAEIKSWNAAWLRRITRSLLEPVR